MFKETKKIAPMFKETKKFIMRKIKKMDYVHVMLPDGYEETYKRYDNVSGQLDSLEKCTLKLVKSEPESTWANQIANVSLKIMDDGRPKKKDPYYSIALLAERMGETGNGFTEAFYGISDAKKKLADEVKVVLSEIETLKRMKKQIDTLVTEVKVLRYDLEEMHQKGDYAEGTKNMMMADYNNKACDAINKMVDFMGGSGLSGMFMTIATKYKDFVLKEGELLENVRNK